MCHAWKRLICVEGFAFIDNEKGGCNEEAR